MLRILIGTLILKSLASLGVESFSLTPRVIGGRPADIRWHPYQVTIHRSCTFTCGGFIISSKWVVTAAHCVRRPPCCYQIGTGSNHKDDGIFYSVKEIVRHPNYISTSADYDIALLRIDGEIKFNNVAQPAKLAEKELATGVMANVTGWGALEENGRSSSKLMVVTVPIVSRSTCQSIYRRMITDRTICAGFVDIGGKDSCQGDSGGPLAAGGTVYGIVSWGLGCGRPYYPGVYTNVARFRTWIKETSGV